MLVDDFNTTICGTLIISAPDMIFFGTQISLSVAQKTL